MAQLDTAAFSYGPDKSRRREWPFWLAFALGLSFAVQLKVGPTLFGSDLIAMAAFPFAFYKLLAKRGRIGTTTKYMFALLLLWLVASIISDALNHTSEFNALRGVFIIPAFGVTFLVIAEFISGHRQRELAFAVGLALGSLIQAALNVEMHDFQIGLKFVYGIPIAIAIASIFDAYNLQHSKGILRSAGALIAMGVFVLWQDFRSLAAFLFLCGIVMARKGFALRRSVRALAQRSPRPLHMGDIWKSAIFILLSIAAIYYAYDYTLSKNILPADVLQRVGVQHSSELGVLFGARPEFLIAAVAIERRPLIGYGSWPQNCEYVRWYDWMRARYNDRVAGPSKSCLIPTHSHILAAWVWAGILAVPFWAYIFWKVSWWCLSATRDVSYREIAPLLMGAVLAWSILFSPFNGFERLWDAYFIAVIFSRINLDRC